MEDYFDLKNCRLCPRRCGRNRYEAAGPCGATGELRAARAALHFWEEPCLSGVDGDKMTPRRGSGAVFFSGCPMRCAFCQNDVISRGRFGKDIPVPRLAEIFEELKAEGAYNINLVSPTPYTPLILEALEGFSGCIPTVWNSSGYENAETVRAVGSAADIWLPDLKYFDSGLSGSLSGAPDYFEAASKAIEEMVRQTGEPRFGSDGMLRRGVIVRHLALPGHVGDSKKVLRWLFDSFGDSVLVSVMSQYTPTPRVKKDPDLSRRLSRGEYDELVELAESLGLEGYFQELSSAQGEYLPDFDLTGV